MHLSRVSVPPASAAHDRCCRRTLWYPGRSPSQTASIAAALAPLHPVPTSPAYSRKNPDGTAGLSQVRVATSLPFARSGPIRLESPVFFLRRLPSVSSPSAPAAESSCPTTSDSRSCTGSLSGSFRNPQSTVHRRRPLPDWPLPFYTPPVPPTSKSQTALPRSQAPPIAGWPVDFSSTTQPLRSIPFPGFHRYYGLFRPSAPHSYSRPCGSST